jgi:hypothetical protein
MNLGSNDEMRDEYELRPGGGVRGKYYERYIQGTSVRLIFSAVPQFVASSTSSAPSIGAITKPKSYPFNVGSLRALAHEG